MTLLGEDLFFIFIIIIIYFLKIIMHQSVKLTDAI